MNINFIFCHDIWSYPLLSKCALTRKLDKPHAGCNKSSYDKNMEATPYRIAN